ncbi:hypothetical protein L2E82_49182 [Cichorium intybus]|uniref:Uncharacterized protein n=1 Tax=Cichorium intybus TaxID=13427 RepID=A0ACB8Z176_CICIN|nr:hypothetical protein L2E82_49182 [Cichorium intybus]
MVDKPSDLPNIHPWSPQIRRDRESWISSFPQRVFTADGFVGTIARGGGGGRHGQADDDVAAVTVEEDDDFATEMEGLDNGNK